MKKLIKITLGIILFFIVGFVLTSIFFLADLRTSDIKNNTQSEEQIQFAKNLLNEAIKNRAWIK